MRLCKKCRTLLEPQDKYCAYCGRPVAAKKKSRWIIIGLLACLALALLAVANLDPEKHKRPRSEEHLALGYQYLEEQNFEQAIAAFDLVLQVEAGNTEAILGKAKVFLAMGDTEEAKAILQQAATRHPSAEIYILLFQICSADDILSALEILHQGYELTTAEELAELWAEEMAKITIEIENASPALGETVRLRLLYGHIPLPAHWKVEYPGQMVPREHGILLSAEEPGLVTVIASTGTFAREAQVLFTEPAPPPGEIETLVLELNRLFTLPAFQHPDDIPDDTLLQILYFWAQEQTGEMVIPAAEIDAACRQIFGPHRQLPQHRSTVLLVWDPAAETYEVIPTGFEWANATHLLNSGAAGDEFFVEAVHITLYWAHYDEDDNLINAVQDEKGNFVGYYGEDEDIPQDILKQLPRRRYVFAKSAGGEFHLIKSVLLD
ncbi:MAG TPA: tetratricopeptide repeat protein [Bacillota bacterium]|nr:tetratricopeptide repeat protein [Bacillota bacterium]HPZ90861.1 tetratricopeptide repeat protein [Bacillota bacterium]HQE02090.1 tetratricopeptide repeat protein [Bacillota bacterium]